MRKSTLFKKTKQDRKKGYEELPIYQHITIFDAHRIYAPKVI